MSDPTAQASEPPTEEASAAAAPFPAAGADAVSAPAAGAPATDAPPPLRVTPRLAERKVVHGKAQIALGSGFSVGGKLIDLSEGGVCVMLDDPVTVKKVCNISCNIFQNGKNHTFSLPSVVAYCVLVSGRGYKVGFQFGPRSPAATQTIADVLKGA